MKGGELGVAKGLIGRSVVLADDEGWRLWGFGELWSRRRIKELEVDGRRQKMEDGRRAKQRRVWLGRLEESFAVSNSFKALHEGPRSQSWVDTAERG